MREPSLPSPPMSTTFHPPLRALFVLAGEGASLLRARAREMPDVDAQTTAVSEFKIARLETDVVVIDGRIPACADLVKDIRSTNRSLPILFVAACLGDVAPASSAGANDFALSDASAAELSMRIQILSSAAVRPLPRVRRIGKLRLDRETRRLVNGSRFVQLSPIELKVFERLLFQVGRPVSRADLERSIWRQSGVENATNVAVVYISYLRRKLARVGEGCRITTLTGVGYSLEVSGSPVLSGRARSRV